MRESGWDRIEVGGKGIPDWHCWAVEIGLERVFFLSLPIKED
jgi:hypothetical protein